MPMAISQHAASRGDIGGLARATGPQAGAAGLPAPAVAAGSPVPATAGAGLGRVRSRSTAQITPANRASASPRVSEGNPAAVPGPPGMPVMAGSAVGTPPTGP